VRSTLFILMIIGLVGCQQTTEKDKSKKDTTDNPLEVLLEGNQRFSNNLPTHPDQTQQRIRELKKGQYPIAAVISCSDSRVPPELIFDQGLGDLFVIRTAGNVIGDYELGSIEYAVEHLNVKLIIVMGHKKCGAVTAFMEHRNDTLDNHIQSIIRYMKEEREEMSLDLSDPSNLDNAIIANVKHDVLLLKESEPLLNRLYTANEIQIIGAIYDIDTGKVSVIPD
jgi:carbonic anhydrase